MAIFQVNLSGILKVLSDSLYSSKEVFVRELLQNAMDAITAKRYKTDFQPEIRVSYFQHEQGDGLIVQDNGIGLTAEEAEAFLSRIGASSKSLDSIEETRSDFIGQFGIGLLSCFMVSDEIVVLTRAYGQEEGVKWVGKIDGSYQSEAAEVDFQGTRVVLKLRSSANLTPDKMANLLRMYGAYLKVPIAYERDGNFQENIQKTFPWEGANQGSHEVALGFGMEQFGISFSHYIPLRDASGETVGMAYIMPRASHQGEEAGHRVYIRDMYITDQAKGLLPNWAFFLRAVVNSANLSPTASRESIYKNDTLDAVQEQLGQSIKQYLVELSERAPQVLQQIVATHSTALKSLAISDPELLTFIADWFRFETSHGPLTLAQIKEQSQNRGQSLFYVPDMDEFRQLSAIASASDVLVVNAGYIYEHDLLNKLSEQDGKHVYQKISTEYFGNVLQELDLEDYDFYRNKLGHIQAYLDEFECEVDLKQFEPESIPALYYMSSKEKLRRNIDQVRSESDDLWSEISGLLFTPTKKAYSAHLYLNFRNPLVQKILRQDPSETEKAVVQTLYVNAMMMGHYPLQQRDLNAMNHNLLYLLNQLSQPS